MQIFGISGGSGTGKSTLLKVLAQKGGKVIDCDALYHQLLKTDKVLVAELTEQFPKAMENGCLNRKELGKLVFENKEALSMLNAITHKHVVKAVDVLLEQYRQENIPFAVIEAIALVESGLATRCDKVICVLAKEEERIRRIMARENVDENYAKSRIASQKPDEFFIMHSDYILENKYETEEQFTKYVESFFEKIWEESVTWN